MLQIGPPVPRVWRTRGHAQGVKLRFPHSRHKKPSRMLPCHDTPAGVGRVPLETRLLQPPAGLPVGVTGETVQALARSEQVSGRLRPLRQMRTRAAQWGSTWTAPCLLQARSLSEKQCSKRYASLVECKDANYSTTKSRLL